ncbi:MAG: NYN domain-containing protein [Rhizomicrobium sp.]
MSSLSCTGRQLRLLWKRYAGTEEKGVDSRIVTDMISLAWINNYDVAVLVSSDRDFVPVAEFLQTKGVKVVHGAFPPVGSQLTQKCWAHINMIAMMPLYERKAY